VVNGTSQTSLALPESMTLDVANQTLASLTQGLRSIQGGVVLNASALKVCDSSAVAVLLALRRAAQELKLDWKIEGAPAHLLDLARLYGVESLLDA